MKAVVHEACTHVVVPQALEMLADKALAMVACKCVGVVACCTHVETMVHAEMMVA